MPYVRKSISKKKTYKKPYRKGASTFRKKVASISKTVALRQQETKHHVIDYGTFQLFHNISRQITVQALQTNQGTGDGSSQGRIGDKVCLRGLSVYLQWLQKFDRPNVTFKVWVLKGRKSALPISVPVKTITGVLMLDPVNTEKISKVLACRTYKFNQNNWVNDGDIGVNKEVVNFRKLWIPLNSAQYHYFDDNNTDGRDYNVAIYVAAYDTQSTLPTDNIAAVHVSTEFFYKDG